MAKITTETTTGTKFDPLNGLNDDLARLGLTPTTETQQFSLGIQQDRLNSFSGIDIGEYKPDSSLFSSDEEALPLLNEQRARDQGWGEQALKGLGRVGGTMLTEILKVPGYLGGAAGSWAMDGDFVENTVNNAWVNAFENLDESIKESIPVHLTKEVQEGGIGTKLMSSAWWATTGADGVGFLLSMYAPGQFLKASKLSLYAAEGVEGMAKFAGASSKFTKALTANNILKGTQAGAKMTAKGIANIESSAAVALNTFVESSAEAANTFDNVKKTYLEQNPNASEDEANQYASNYAASVMKANIGVLALSNLFDEVFLFKGFGAENAAKESIIGKLFKDGVFDTEAISKLKRAGIKEFSKKSLPKLASNFAKEGMFEEGLQTKIQQHYENVASGKTNAGFWDDVVGNYFEDLMTNPEMQESVVLGGILGGGASLVGLANEIKSKNDLLYGKQNNYPSFIGRVLNKKEKTEAPGLVNILQDNFVNSFRTIHDIAEFDDNGKPIYENGKIKINEAKLTELIEQKQNMLTLNQLHNVAVLEGNKAEEDMYGDQLAFNYFLPFLQQDGGYDVLKQHIDQQLVELMAKKNEDATGKIATDEDKAGIKNKLMERLEKFHKIYDEVNTTTNTELHVRPTDKNYGAWKDSVRNRKMQSLIAFESASKALNEINTKFPEELSDDILATLSPVDVIKYNFGKKYKKYYQDIIDQSRDMYSKLSSGKGLKEDYEKYNKKVEELDKKVVEETEKEFEKDDVVATSDDFESQINNAGYETQRSNQFKGPYIKGERLVVENKDGKRGYLESQINNAGYETQRSNQFKGFYIKGERIVVQDSKGNRGYIESVYDPKTKTSSQYFVTANSRKLVTDGEGNFIGSFLKLGFKPITRTQLDTERKALAIKERKAAQLRLLQEEITFRSSQYASHQREVDEINNQIADYESQLDAATKELTAINSKSDLARNLKKKQVQLKIESLQSLINTIEDTINNLRKRRDDLVETLPRILAIQSEYQKLYDLVKESEVFSFNQELQKTEQELLTRDIEDWEFSEKDIAGIRNLIVEIEDKIKYLEAVKLSIEKVLKANQVFIDMIMLNEDEYTKAFTAFDNFFEGIPLPYNIERIYNNIVENIHNVVNGETLTMNNIITNAVELVSWFNANPNEISKRFGQDGPVTEIDMYNKMAEIFKPYVNSMNELNQNSPLTLEDIHDLKYRAYATNKQIQELNDNLIRQRERLDTSSLFRKYITLRRMVQDKVEKRYNDLRNKEAARNLDYSQKQNQSLPEPVSEADARDIFYTHALPSTPLSTTGLSVLYEKEGANKGKDKIDENGFPVINDNEFQRLWFLTVDKLSDSINDYMLLPVKAKYDSSDDFQKAIEANFPNESQRTDHDVFVFLVDKTGKPVKVDKQGNILNDGGTFVFTSLRKPEEIYPEGKPAKIMPDYILTEYLTSLGINISLKYQNVKGKKITEVIRSKTALNTLKKYVDNDATFDDLMKDATEYSKNQYKDFISSLGKGFLKIEGVTRGYHLYQLDKDGKRKRHKPLEVFKNINLAKGFGTGQLQGGTLGVVVKSVLESKGQLITLPEGSVYVKFQNGEFATLETRMVNDNESRLLLYLLSLADTSNPLNSITIPFPKKKDGSSYFYRIGNYTIKETIPVFARRLPNGQPFSLLHTIINYGFKSEGKNKKGEIYIQNGKIHYTTFDGEVRQISVKELSDAIASDKFEKHSDAVKDLFDFLKTKRFNIEKNLLTSNPIFMKPSLKRLGNGKYYVKFDTNGSYYDHLFKDVLTTSATVKEGYPSQLQRNVIFDKTVTTVVETPKASTGAKATKPKTQKNVQDNKKDSWLAEKKQNIIKARQERFPELNTLEATEMFNSTFKQMLESQIVGFTVSEADWKMLRDTFIKPEKIDELPADFLKAAEQVHANRTSVEAVKADIVEENKKDVPLETPAEKLAKMRENRSSKLIPKSKMAKPTKNADKLLNFEKMLDNFITSGIVQKKCK